MIILPLFYSTEFISVRFFRPEPRPLYLVLTTAKILRNYYEYCNLDNFLGQVEDLLSLDLRIGLHYLRWVCWSQRSRGLVRTI